MGEAPIGADYLCRCVVGLMESDEHPWDDFAQAPVLSAREGGGVEPLVVLRRIGIDGDIEERVGWGFVVINGALSALGINAEIDLAALS